MDELAGYIGLNVCMLLEKVGAWSLSGECFQKGSTNIGYVTIVIIVFVVLSVVFGGWQPWEQSFGYQKQQPAQSTSRLKSNISVVRTCKHCMLPLGEGDAFCARCGVKQEDASEPKGVIPHVLPETVESQQASAIATEKQASTGKNVKSVRMDYAVLVGLFLLLFALAVIASYRSQETSTRDDASIEQPVERSSERVNSAQANSEQQQYEKDISSKIAELRFLNAQFKQQSRTELQRDVIRQQTKTIVSQFRYPSVVTRWKCLLDNVIPFPDIGFAGYELILNPLGMMQKWMIVECDTKNSINFIIAVERSSGQNKLASANRGKVVEFSGRGYRIISISQLQAPAAAGTLAPVLESDYSRGVVVMINGTVELPGQ
jgi:hypothetical protein